MPKSPRVSFNRNDAFIHIGGFFGLSNTFSGPDAHGVQHLEAFRYAINSVNSGDFGPTGNRSLVYKAFDSKGIPDISGSGAFALATSQNFTVLIGPSEAEEMRAISSLLHSHGIGLIGFLASSDSLTPKTHPNFARTSPKDSDINMGILSIMRHFNWSLIAAIFTDDTYGRSGRTFFLRSQSQGTVAIDCLTTIPVLDSPESIKRAMPLIEKFSSCISDSTVNVVLIYSNPESVYYILSSLHTQEKSNHLAFISTWAEFITNPTRYPNNRVLLDLLKGTISVVPKVGNISGFVDYFSRLDPINNNYSFFRDYWEAFFRCKMPNMNNKNLPICAPNVAMRGVSSNCLCTGLETLRNSPIDLMVGYVIDAVLLVWTAIQMILFDCGRATILAGYDLCGNKISGVNIIDIIRAMKFTGVTGRISFGGSLERLDPEFDVIQFDEHGSITIVGSYNNETLMLNESMMNWKNGYVPESYIVPSDFTLTTTEGMVLFTLSLIILILIALAGVMVVNNRKNLVIRSLSPLFLLFILLGIFFFTLSTVVGVLPTTDSSCVVQKLFMFIASGLVFGSLFAKMYRIHKTFHSIRIRASGYSNLELTKIVAVICLGEIVLFLLYCFLEGVPNATVSSNPNDPLYLYMDCVSNNPDATALVFMIGIWINLLLLFADVVLAFINRDVRSEYNESQRVAFTAYGCFSIVVVISALYFALAVNDKYTSYNQMLLVAIGGVLISLCCLLFLFAPICSRLYKKENMIAADGSQQYSSSMAGSWANSNNMHNTETFGTTKSMEASGTQTFANFRPSRPFVTQDLWNRRNIIFLENLPFESSESCENSSLDSTLPPSDTDSSGSSDSDDMYMSDDASTLKSSNLDRTV